MNQKPSAEQKLLAGALDRLSTKLGAAYRPVNDAEHRFEHAGWLLLRTAVLMIQSGDKAHQLARDWAARGFPAGTGGEPGGSGAVWVVDDEHGQPDSVPVTSTEAASLKADEWELVGQAMRRRLVLLDRESRALESEIAHTVRVMPNEGRRSTLIDCANPHCETVMTGLGEDRPKDGRCPRCYMFRYRNRRDWTPNGLDIEMAG